MSRVRFSVALERNILESTAPNATVVDDPREAAEVAVEMANRPGEAGGSVVISTVRLPNKPIHLTLVERGDLVELVERDVREKSQRDSY